MPSWHSRRLFSSSASQPPEADAGRFPKSESDIGALRSVSPQHGRQTRPWPSTSPRHGRSHSHPFTSLSGPTKKGDGQFQDQKTSPAYNPVLMLTDATSGIASSVSPEDPVSKTGDEELMSGKCTTCDSTVTWPKHLGVFRCTVCLMINDLQPRGIQPLRKIGGKDSQGRRCSGCTCV